VTNQKCVFLEKTNREIKNGQYRATCKIGDEDENKTKKTNKQASKKYGLHVGKRV
jgi:hypothetical protein